MKKITNFKYFLSKLNLLIGASFFYSQSTFSEVFKDFLFNLLINLKLNRRVFVPISGSAKIEPPIFDINNGKVRGNSESSNSYSYITDDNIDPIFKQIIFENKNIIESYLGKNFLY